jgi:hypothetical protein
VTVTIAFRVLGIEKDAAWSRAEMCSTVLLAKGGLPVCIQIRGQKLMWKAEEQNTELGAKQTSVGGSFK